MKALTKILKSKKGLTLMELIVGILMFTIISITISMLLAPILMSYTRANDFAEYNALLDNIANRIVNDLSQSTMPPVFTPDPGPWAQDDGIFLEVFTNNRIIRYALSGGVLQRADRLDAAGDPDLHDVFSEDFYRRKDVSFMLEEADENPDFTGYRLTVRLTERRTAGFQIYREYAIRPLMLNQN